MLTQEYKNEREKKKKDKESMKLAKALNREAKKNIAYGVKPKSKKEKKPKKIKKPSRSHLVKKLDAIFSKFIRLKYADKFGMVACYTSWVVKHRKEMQCWHFITRGCYALRRSEINCRPQSYVDNVILHGNYIEYTLRMIWELGDEVVQELLFIKMKPPEKIHTRKIEEMIVEYTEKVWELLANMDDFAINWPEKPKPTDIEVIEWYYEEEVEEDETEPY